MDKVFTVAWREFFETVRTKAFFLGAVLMPLLMVGFIFGSQAIARWSEKGAVPLRTIAVVDQTGAVFPGFAEQIVQFNEQNPQHPFAAEQISDPDSNVEQLRERVRSGGLYAYLVIPAAVIDGNEGPILGRKDSQLQAGRDIEHMVQQAVVAVRFQRHDPPVDYGVIRYLERGIELRSVDVQTGTEETGNEFARILTPFIFMFLLWMGTLGISQGLLTSVIEEKSSRIVEVLLSAVSPLQLMAGKILGMVGVGVLLLAIYGTIGYGGARARDMAYLVTASHLTYMALYFVPAFLFSSAVLAGIGSACNTLKDAQSMSFPLMIINVVPMMLWLQITQNPSSTLSIVLSFIPPITPFIMILRICADPHIPLWQIVATLVVLWAAVIAVIWAAGKVFRVGVLMYGKPPTPRELLHWVRYA